MKTTASPCFHVVDAAALTTAKRTGGRESVTLTISPTNSQRVLSVAVETRLGCCHQMWTRHYSLSRRHSPSVFVVTPNTIHSTQMSSQRHTWHYPHNHPHHIFNIKITINYICLQYSIQQLSTYRHPPERCVLHRTRRLNMRDSLSHVLWIVVEVASCSSQCSQFCR